MAGRGKVPEIRLQRHGQLVAPQANDVRVCASVGPAGEAVALWVDATDLAKLEKKAGHNRFSDPETTRPVTARVTVDSTVTSIAWLPVAFPFVQPLPDGEVLVVGTRTRWQPKRPHDNAVVYSAEGEPLAEERLGHGIAHVLTSREGAVWVGYFDEGVYGNDDWEGPDGRPPSAAGLVRFDARLQPQWGISRTPRGARSTTATRSTSAMRA